MIGLYKKREKGMMSTIDREELEKREKSVEQMKNKLTKKAKNQQRQQKHRDNRKRKHDALDPHTRKLITGKETATAGQPPKGDNSALIETIAQIAITGSAADVRRRSEVIRTVKTLDDLTSSLRSAGFDLSRSGIYLRLIPRNVRTIEGKRHRNVAPVKLSQPENSHHKYHISTKFAHASIRYLEEIASFLGPEEVTFHSQDDKAKVPIGIPAAKKHVPLLMHLEYKVQLPDHDFVVAANHKLIPSIIGVI